MSMTSSNIQFGQTASNCLVTTPYPKSYVGFDRSTGDSITTPGKYSLRSNLQRATSKRSRVIRRGNSRRSGYVCRRLVMYYSQSRRRARAAAAATARFPYFPFSAHLSPCNPGSGVFNPRACVRFYNFIFSPRARSHQD